MKKKIAFAAGIVFCGYIFAQISLSQSVSQSGSGAEQTGSSGVSTATMNFQNFSTDENQFDGDNYAGTNLYIDESAYYLGSGDVLRAVIWGVKETIIDIPLVNETCMIPSVGSLDVDSIPLIDVRKNLTALIKNKYKAKRIDVYLTKVKEVSSQVWGEVKNPNTYSIRGNLSISSIIEQIGGTTENANLREVQLIHPKYGTRVVDVVKMNRYLDYPSANLRNGDRIFVPMRDLRISISGDVNYSGDYDFVSGDKLSDLIKLSGGMLSTADSSRIIVSRFIGHGDSIEQITLSFNDADNFALEKDDRVLVSKKAKYRPVSQVKIFGEVSFPGVYSIQENKTRLIDIINQAGGLTEQAFLGGSRIVRKNFSDASQNELNKLKNLSAKIQITPVENNFMKYKSDGETQVGINFSNFNFDKNSIENIILKEGDEIFIEKNDLMINVMGGVVRPGLVEFSEGKNLDYYIEQAGGYQADAIKRKMRIVKAGSEVWLKPSNVKSIEQGDAIWIPQKDYVERQERLQTVNIRSGVLSVIATIASTVMTALTAITLIRSENN